MNYAFGHGALAPYIRERLKASRSKKSLIHWHWAVEYYIDVIGIDPRNTLILIFTNKSAREMRSCALALIN